MRNHNCVEVNLSPCSIVMENSVSAGMMSASWTCSNNFSPSPGGGGEGGKGLVCWPLQYDATCIMQQENQNKFRQIFFQEVEIHAVFHASISWNVGNAECVSCGNPRCNSRGRRT